MRAANRRGDWAAPGRVAPVKTEGGAIMRIIIGSDHRGFEVKRNVIELCRRLGHEVIDAGTHSADPVDYPDVAAVVARKVAGHEVERGILICGSGIGMSIVANKFPGVRAAPCHDDLSAEMSRRHNDLNVLCLSADMLGEKLIEIGRAHV